MTARRSLPVGALLLFAQLPFTGCRTAPEGTFHVPRDEFLVTTYSLLAFPMEGPELDPTDLARIDADVLATLGAYGFEMVDGGILDDFDQRTSGVDAALFKGLLVRDGELVLYVSIADAAGNVQYEGFGSLGPFDEGDEPSALLADERATARAVRRALLPLAR